MLQISLVNLKFTLTTTEEEHREQENTFFRASAQPNLSGLTANITGNSSGMQLYPRHTIVNSLS
jgi:hypothetical protein